ncbi:MAG: hypothetical protein KDC45_02380 [Bacteroidetes bacterium]|nr:hypothetical protein [Bacteroidota bacterium]
MLLKYGLNYMPASLNIIAKRIGISETDKNLDILRSELEKLVKKKKAFRSGNRFAIDAEGAKTVFSYSQATPDQLPTPKDFRKAFREFTRQS